MQDNSGALSRIIRIALPNYISRAFGSLMGRDRRLVDIWPHDRQRFTAWHNILNEDDVKARYSKHFEISEKDSPSFRNGQLNFTH